MQQVANFPYQKHLFICVNQRDAPRSCCAATGSEELFIELKKWVAEQGLTQKVWVTRTRCLGFCNDVGATMVLYPERKWFLQVRKEDLGEVKKAVLGGIN